MLTLPCGEGGQFALRIGRMRVIPLSRGNVASATKGLPSGYGFAEGDRAVNDCLAAIHPHPSRRLCCYAKRNRSAIRQPSFKGNLCTQASRHLPHKGEGFLLSNVWFIAEGDSSIFSVRALYRHNKGQHFSTRSDAALIRSCGYAFLSKAALPSRGNGHRSG